MVLPGGSAHAALGASLRQPNKSSTPWTPYLVHVDLGDLVHRQESERFVSFRGGVRHTHLTVQANILRHATDANRAPLAAATREGIPALIEAIEAAGSALSGAPRTIGEIRLERIPFPSPTWSDSGDLRLTVLPWAGQAEEIVSLRLSLFWRLQAEAPFWRGRQTFVSWIPNEPAVHGRAHPIPLQPRAADDARLELRLVRSHDEGAAYALGEIRFEIAEGARIATWQRSE